MDGRGHAKPFVEWKDRAPLDHRRRLYDMITEPRIVTHEALRTATIHVVIPGQDMPKYMDPAIQEILRVIAEQGIRPSGPLFSYHHRRPTDTFDFELGFPVARIITPRGRVQASSLPSARVVRSVYQGPYEGLAKAWPELQKWVRDHRLAETGRFWECYLNDPEEVADPKEYRTELNWVIG